MDEEQRRIDTAGVESASGPSGGGRRVAVRRGRARSRAGLRSSVGGNGVGKVSNGFFHQTEGDPEGLGRWLRGGETSRETSGSLEERNGF